MLIKTKDSLEPALEALETLLGEQALTKVQQEAIEEEKRNVQAGARGEKQAAYFIDFELKDSRNYGVLHDLRLEHNERVAQIDHLIIGRCLDIILIESKNIGTAIRTNTEGEFEVRTRYGWKGMSSPVEQSKRHARVLGDLLANLDLLPRRLGLQLRPTFHHWVLVPPECNVTRKPKDATIIKMDLFESHMEKWIKSGSLNLLKACSSETVMDLARTLAQHHRPITIDFAAKFGVTPATESQKLAVPDDKAAVAPAAPDSSCCDACGVSLETKVVHFCRMNRDRFEGKLYCRSCQGKPRKSPACAQCGASVDEKVVAFCRFNSRKFGKRVLCRDCQASVPAMA